MKTAVLWAAFGCLVHAGKAAGEEARAHAWLVAADIGSAPWSAVGRINNSAYGRCSAVLVRPDVAVTAAHCLYNIASGRFLQPASIHLLFGFSKGRYGFHTTAARITIGPGYVPGGLASSAPNDWAVLGLSAPVPKAFVPMPVMGREEPAPEHLTAAGFGQERSEVLSTTGPCTVLSHPGDALVVTDCRLSHGFSGGPMVDAATGRLAAISVATAGDGGPALGFAVPIAAVEAALP